MWIFTDKKGWEYKPYDQVEKKIEEKSEPVVKKTRSRKRKNRCDSSIMIGVSH